MTYFIAYSVVEELDATQPKNSPAQEDKEKSGGETTESETADEASPSQPNRPQPPTKKRCASDEQANGTLGDGDEGPSPSKYQKVD